VDLEEDINLQTTSLVIIMTLLTQLQPVRWKTLLLKGHTFTEKEYKQIMEMLNKDVKESKQVNMAGITTCLMTNFFTQDWIIDSGATHHIIANKQLLTKRHELTKSQKNQVHLPTDARW